MTDGAGCLFKHQNTTQQEKHLVRLLKRTAGLQKKEKFL